MSVSEKAIKKPRPTGEVWQALVVQRIDQTLRE